jgi:hypothetical protein
MFHTANQQLLQCDAVQIRIYIYIYIYTKVQEEYISTNLYALREQKNVQLLKPQGLTYSYSSYANYKHDLVFIKFNIIQQLTLLGT